MKLYYETGYSYNIGELKNTLFVYDGQVCVQKSGRYYLLLSDVEIDLKYDDVVHEIKKLELEW